MAVERGKRRNGGPLYIYISLTDITLTIGLPSRKPDENSYFLQMLSIIFETYHYYIHLSYEKRRDEEGSFKSIGNYRFIFWLSSQ